MSRYKSAFYESSLSDWRPFEFWTDDGAKDTAERARAKWHELLDGYEAPKTDPAVAEALDAYVANRKDEIGDAEI